MRSGMEHHVGQRLSLKGHTFTVRYIGPVADKPGEWLGVEWDDSDRGKHDGTHNGIKYFECRSSFPSAASFLRPNQKWDQPRTFLQALREKYMPEDAGTGGDIVYFSSKKAEEVGFEKFAKRQAQLQGIHVLVLDDMRIRCDQLRDDCEEISRICGHITELNLRRNLFESLDEILGLVRLLPKLTNIIIDDNGFSVSNSAQPASELELRGIRLLSLQDTWLSWQEIYRVASYFPNATNLNLAGNGFRTVGHEPLPERLEHLHLPDNAITTLSDLEHLSSCRNLEWLSLKRNRISAVSKESQQFILSETLVGIDLSQNDITYWSFFDALGIAYPSLKHLIVTGNPIYKDLVSAEGKPLAAEDGYMLTVARLPCLEALNYSKITDKERLNAETYYIGQIATELSRSSPGTETEILKKHPRWKALCDEYGEPTIRRAPKADALDPNSLAARLIAFTFVLPTTALPECTTRTWEEEVPKSFNIYSVLGLVGKRLGIMPLKLRLIWETGERDPAGRDGGYTGPEWWDSSGEEDDISTSEEHLVIREVELVAGTRTVSTYIESRTARVRVELKG